MVQLITITAAVMALARAVVWSFSQTWDFISPGLEEGVSFALAVFIQFGPTVLWPMSKKMEGTASDVAYMAGWAITLIDMGTNIGAFINSQDLFKLWSTRTIFQIIMLAVCILITQGEELIAWLMSHFFDVLYEFQRARGRKPGRWMVWASEAAHQGVPQRQEREDRGGGGSGSIQEIIEQRRKEIEHSQKSNKSHSRRVDEDGLIVPSFVKKIG